MGLEELVGRHVLIVTPALTTPPDKRLKYVIGKVDAIHGPMMKLSDGMYTHLEGKVWESSFEKVTENEAMRPLGYDGTCWVNYTSERMRIYPFA